MHYFADDSDIGIQCPNYHRPSSQGEESHQEKIIKKNTGKKAMIFTAAVDDGIPDITTALVIDYSSELGNKLTIYLNAEDLKHIALCWGKTQHRLTKVDTTKGAERFENHKYGLVWITIPAKGMLLDSKQAHQLANEFKSLQQSVAPITSPATTLIAEPARG